VTGKSRKDVIVVGVGNALLSDEGIGVHLIRRLSQSADKFPTVDFLDAGTGGLSVLHLIANRKKAVIIDCAKMGEQPGTVRRFGIDDVKSIKTLSGLSLHEADISRIISLAKFLGQLPKEVVFFGIEPKSTAPGENLSEKIACRIDEYIRTILLEFARSPAARR